MQNGSTCLVSVQEAATRLGVAPISIYRWTEDGSLPSIKLGGRRLVSEATIDAIIASASGRMESA